MIKVLLRANEEDSLLCQEAANLFLLAGLIFFHILYHKHYNRPTVLTHSDVLQTAGIIIVMLIFMRSVVFCPASYILMCVSENICFLPWMGKSGAWEFIRT